MKNKSVDTPFLLVLCAIVAFGLLIFTSAALGLLARGGASFSSVAASQLLLGLVCGGIACFTLAKIDYRLWRKFTPYLFGFAVFLTLLVFEPHVGLSLKGAARWVEIGPISFQPEEILKFATIAFLSAIYATRLKKIETLKGGLLPLIGIVGPVALILLLQPNTAGVIMIGVAGAGVLFAAGGRAMHMGLLILLGIVAIGIAAVTYPHVAERIQTFMHHAEDPQGAGYQIQQSLIAVGSGGITGRGFGQSIQKFSYLPEPIGDSIFAVAAEEFGFAGSVVLVLLFATFGLLGLRIAARAPDPFGGLMVTGFVILIVGQSFFNIASTLGIVPLVGVPLIFVSHGGTALAMALAEAGVILSVSRRMKHR
ncbi:MAG: Stage V sporulation protein E Required for spore cortex synthesi [Parcubacteria group bacterium Gr01-1014_56]|nr:MAG: Stage V sporulation protein E Required for spore cortex synthesi [Parcubacteria group bacterium Gr01-1014_56]